MVLLCLKTQMISQAYIMVNWLKHYGKRIRSFVLLFVLRVTFISGNFATCFFQSNDKWVYAFNTYLTDSYNKLFSFILITVTLLISIYDD